MTCHDMTWSRTLQLTFRDVITPNHNHIYPTLAADGRWPTDGLERQRGQLPQHHRHLHLQHWIPRYSRYVWMDICMYCWQHTLLYNRWHILSYFSYTPWHILYTHHRHLHFQHWFTRYPRYVFWTYASMVSLVHSLTRSRVLLLPRKLT